MLQSGNQQRRVVAIGPGADAPYGDALPVHCRRALGALLAPIHRAFAGLLSPARRFGDAPVHRHLRKLKTDESVVGRERYLPKRLHHPELDPLLASVPNRGGRTPFLGDPAISATEHQDLNELLEDHPVGDARLVAAQRVMDHSVREQGQELLEDGLDDVWWECGHGLSSLSFGKLGNSPNDRASRARLSSRRLPIRAASKLNFLEFRNGELPRNREIRSSTSENSAFPDVGSIA